MSTELQQTKGIDQSLTFVHLKQEI